MILYYAGVVCANGGAIRSMRGFNSVSMSGQSRWSFLSLGAYDTEDKNVGFIFNGFLNGNTVKQIRDSRTLLAVR